jgi:fumarate reductase flavoprotein subunit
MAGVGLGAVNAKASADGVYTPGTYSATATGMGTVTVTATFDENSLVDVVLDVSEETPAIGQVAAEELKAQVMAAGSADIDGVSGASLTSEAVRKALVDCAKQGR